MTSVNSNDKSSHVASNFAAINCGKVYLFAPVCDQSLRDWISDLIIGIWTAIRLGTGICYPTS